MQQWTFFLDDVQTQSEPQGWNDLRLTVIRDRVTHGIFFEASTNTLTFYGQDAEYLRGKYENAGFEANVVFRAESDCDETYIIGRLDFGTYKYNCGETCSVEINLEREGCLMTLKNRMNQKVDLSSNRAFDKITVLPNYPGLNFDLEMLSQQTEAAVEGYVGDREPDVFDQTFTDIESSIGSLSLYVRPTYYNEVKNSFNQGQLIPESKFGENQFIGLLYTGAIVSPVLLMAENKSCFDNDIRIQGRIKGSYLIESAPDDFSLSVTIGLRQWTAEENGSRANRHELIPDDTVFNQNGNIPSTVSGDFDVSFDVTVPFVYGNGIYPHVFISAFEGDESIDTLRVQITFDEETFIKIDAVRDCPPSDATVSLIHEAGSRIVEAITDGCMRMRSDYYGRTDSQPFAAIQDGCGGLRAITSGLRLRNAANPTHFISMNEFFNGLRAIDNVGMGIEDDPNLPGKQVVRLEAVEYFYKDTELMRILNIPRATFFSEPDKVYSKILIGYNKWEVERVNGLDEPNSNKEFRTSLTMIENEINLQSNFVAGGYPIEVTRQQSYADTGAADTTYDNETFIICVSRTGNVYYDSFVVEQGGTSVTGVYSPTTIYNWRIRPRFNLMRWWKSLIQSYRNLNNSTSRLFFMAGTGNLLASGQDSAPCAVAASAKAENVDMDRTELLTGTLPIWKPERVEFEYPLSVSEYNQIKQNPYSYITFQCGNGDLMQGYIQNIEYTPADSIAKFNLLLKWPTQ